MDSFDESHRVYFILNLSLSVLFNLFFSHSFFFSVGFLVVEVVCYHVVFPVDDTILRLLVGCYAVIKSFVIKPLDDF